MSTANDGDEAITAAGLTALEAELHQLETNGRREMAARILAAREHGDLKENAEYHIAKEDQAHLETKIRRLRERLQKAIVVEADTDDDVFSFGRTAEVRDEDSGAVHKWTMVGATEADLAEGKLSAQSPVARALVGHRAGDLVEVQTPGGSRKYRLQKLL